MKHTILILLLLLQVLAEDRYPLIGIIGIGRGKYPGDYVTEIRIDHTIYVSADVCKAQTQQKSRYPARMEKQTVWLRVGTSVCKYHITDEHPYLSHREAKP